MKDCNEKENKKRGRKAHQSIMMGQYYQYGTSDCAVSPAAVCKPETRKIRGQDCKRN
jgi:hypothetical protein